MIYAGNTSILPAGWDEGTKLFAERFQTILRPITIKVSTDRVKVADVWIEPLADQSFLLTLGSNPHEEPKNEENAVHELTHALHMSYRPREATWIQEGVALLSEFVVLDHPSKLEQVAYRTPEGSLIDDKDLKSEKIHGDPTTFRRYGQWRLFFKFLYEQCGEQDLLTRLITSPSESTGVDFLNEELGRTDLQRYPKFCADFDSFFTEFETRKFSQVSVGGLDRDSPFHGVVLDSPKLSLEPYSANAYYHRAQRCAPQEIPVNAEVCLQIRTN